MASFSRINADSIYVIIQTMEIVLDYYINRSGIKLFLNDLLKKITYICEIIKTGISHENTVEFWMFNNGFSGLIK